ncbi:phosphoglycerate mutase-like protein [Neurospora crassa]|nr:phosphoglycerate mutase-like protein [Neurospora crassa]
MHTNALLLASIPAATAAETILGAYIFSRHGDRTTKAYSPTKLTALGAEQVYLSGSWYRSRYIDEKSSTRINGISSDLADLTELAVIAPADNVLQGSAGFFLQGLYPPAGSVNSQKLANGTTIEAPLSGYQYIPVNSASVTSRGSNQAESSAWLQGNSGCPAAVNSSQAYYQSKEYLELLGSTKEFYQSLLPVYEATFPSESATFKNAYSIFDYIHVSTIHNASIPSSNLLTPSNLQTLSDLANIHEFGLGYNASSPIRAVAGSVLASHIVSTLNSSISSSSQKLNIQFGPYGTFGSFFGLSQLPAVSPDFTAIVDYASSMTFELFTTSTSSSPSENEVFVRFLFANGTASDSNPAKVYPLFGQDKTELPWTTFVSEMNKIALEGGSKEWCDACGEKTGQCADYYPAESAGVAAAAAKSGSGMSNAVAGVIGAMVTLGVVLGLQALILGVGGLRLTKRRKQDPSEVFQVSAGKTSFSDTSSTQKA